MPPPAAGGTARPGRARCYARRRSVRIDSSAVRFATSAVSPSVTPSAPTTDSVAAMKILARRPSRGAIHRIACFRLRSKRRSLQSRYRYRQVPEMRATCACERASLETLQKLHQVRLLGGRQRQVQACVVVRDDGAERREAAVVIVGRVLPQGAQRRGAVFAGRPASREAGIGAHFGGGVQAEAGGGVLRRYVAGG